MKSIFFKDQILQIIFFIFGYFLIFLVSSLLLLTNISKHGTSDDIYDQFASNYVTSLKYYENRDLSFINSDLEDRKRFRWAYIKIESTFLIPIYKNFGSKSFVFAYVLLYALYVLMTFYFLNKFIHLINRNNNLNSINNFLFIFILTSFLVYLLYFISYLSVTGLSFNIIETLCLISSIFFSYQKKFFPFIFFIILATINRESGIILGFIWIIFNGISKKAIFLALLPLFILLLLNIDLLKYKNFYNLSLYVPTEKVEGHVTFFDLFDLPLTSIIWMLLNHLLIYYPLIFLLFTKINFDKISLKLIIIFSSYSIVFLLGSTLADYTPRIILVPVILSFIIHQFLSKLSKE